MKNGVQKALLSAAVLIIFILLFVTGCASMFSADEAMEEIAWELADRITERPEVFSGKTIAVYYFTEEDQESPISGYLIDTLTSRIARVAGEESLDITIVSRQVLDRILKEMEFQLSALADEDTQIKIGRQLGADIILTGTVTSVHDDYRINAQLVDLESGAVLDGYLYEFWMD